MTSKFIFAALALTLCVANAQTSAPTTVQTAPATPVTVAAPPPAVAADSAQATLKALQALKATNDAILKKQADTLKQLEEMETAAEQLKVFSKRL
jgi:ABC-type Fe3+-hydroxamate transport system substrate-binding protein